MKTYKVTPRPNAQPGGDFIIDDGANLRIGNRCGTLEYLHTNGDGKDLARDAKFRNSIAPGEWKEFTVSEETDPTALLPGNVVFS